MQKTLEEVICDVSQTTRKHPVTWKRCDSP